MSAAGYVWILSDDGGNRLAFSRKYQLVNYLKRDADYGPITVERFYCNFREAPVDVTTQILSEVRA